jgi:hypothetical protein
LGGVVTSSTITLEELFSFPKPRIMGWFYTLMVKGISNCLLLSWDIAFKLQESTVWSASTSVFLSLVKSAISW